MKQIQPIKPITPVTEAQKITIQPKIIKPTEELTTIKKEKEELQKQLEIVNKRCRDLEKENAQLKEEIRQLKQAKMTPHPLQMTQFQIDLEEGRDIITIEQINQKKNQKKDNQQKETKQKIYYEDLEQEFKKYAPELYLQKVKTNLNHYQIAFTKGQQKQFKIENFKKLMNVPFCTIFILVDGSLLALSSVKPVNQIDNNKFTNDEQFKVYLLAYDKTICSGLNWMKTIDGSCYDFDEEHDKISICDMFDIVKNKQIKFNRKMKKEIEEGNIIKESEYELLTKNQSKQSDFSIEKLIVVHWND